MPATWFGIRMPNDPVTRMNSAAGVIGRRQRWKNRIVTSRSGIVTRPTRNSHQATYDSHQSGSAAKMRAHRELHQAERSVWPAGAPGLAVPQVNTAKTRYLEIPD